MERFIMFINFILFLIILGSCNKDNNEFTDPYLNYQKQILGKWFPVDAVIKGIAYPYKGHEDCKKDYFEFTADNILREVNIIQCLEILYGEDVYKIDNNVLTIRYGARESYEVVIENLNDHSLGLLFLDFHYGDGSIEEVRINYKRE